MTKIIVPTPKVKNVSVPLVCEGCADGCCEVPPDDVFMENDCYPQEKPCDDVDIDYHNPEDK